MKNVDIKLLPISSPICQVLIQEQIALQKEKEATLDRFIANCKEMLVIRIDGNLVCYGTFGLFNGQIMRINSLYFRGILKNHMIAQYWLSRCIKRKLEKKCYFNFLIAS